MRQVLECRGGVFARQHAEDHHLVLEAERRQHRGDVAGVAVAQHVAQTRVVARAQHGGQFVGWPGRLADGCERGLAFWAFELLFHLSQCRSDHVVVMHVGPDGLTASSHSR